MNLLRKIVFYLFLLVFIVGCPLLVMYSLGYLLKPSAEPQIVKMGLIHLASIPEAAEVMIEGRKGRYKTPAVISDLVPGEYQVTVASKGYVPWTKRISVEAGKAQSFDKIFLLPDPLIPDVLVPAKVTGLLSASPKTCLVFQRGMTLGDLYILDLGELTTEPLFQPVEGKTPLSKIKAVYSRPESEHLVIEASGTEGSQWYWVEIGSRGFKTVSLTSLILRSPEKIFWDPVHAQSLYVYAEGIVDRIDLSNSSVTPRFAEGLGGFGIDHSFFGTKVYALTRDGEFLRYTEDGSKKEVLYKNPDFFRTLMGDDPFYEITAYDEKVFFFLGGETGRLFSNKLPYIFSEQGIREIVYDRAASKNFIFLSKNRAGVLEFAGKPLKGEVFETMPAIEWIYESRGTLKRVFWFYEGSHFLFSDEKQLYLAEYGRLAADAVMPMVPLEGGAGFAFNEKTGQVFYVDAQTGHLNRLQMVPQNVLIPSSLRELAQGKYEFQAQK